ncbi:MAG: T9SS type A sorting domain-containing protein, partial [Bacteroidales bacterium]|nr:T9SS type A sorting domain-containing protein [Bacteroidales bacterium]
SYTGTMSNGTLNSDNCQLYYTEITGDYAALRGFNLIGNPYTHNIKKGTAADASISNTYLETGFYKLSNNGQWAACTDDETIIGVGEAILVQATSEANGHCLAFSDVLPSVSKNRDNNDNIMFTVANSQYSDVTYALFEEGHGLTKIDHRNAEVPMLYIPKNGENLAIATMSDNTKVFPLNFKAMTMGSYTISCKAEGNFSYLHLFDKLTGEDVDLLLEKEYSFIGVPSDRDDRFVVYLEYYDNSELSGNFAYQNGTDVIVSGAGNLQVFDVMGRMVADQRINGVQTITMPQGVYIFRLEGKTQKIVIR